MRKIILLVTICLISIFSFGQGGTLIIFTSGQEGLLITNKKSGKAWMYEKGSTVTYVKFGDREYSTGTLNAILDTSAVVFGKDTVKLSVISGIRKKSTLHVITRILGMPLMLAGSVAIGSGAAAIYQQPDSDRAISFFLLGVGMFAVGYLPYQINMRNLEVGPGGTWTIVVYKKLK